VDPTIFPPEYYGQPPGDSSYIARRRNLFASPDEMYQRFRERPPFSQWRADVLHDYCDYGLLPSDGGYVLACPPAVEASIYPLSVDPESNLYSLIPSIEQPVTVMRAGTPWVPGVFNLNASPTAPDLASAFPRGRDIVLEGRGHYIPMEIPEVVVEEIRRRL
jgi:pimeloyl-ACP methyl ester carboxylesterase